MYVEGRCDQSALNKLEARSLGCPVSENPWHILKAFVCPTTLKKKEKKKNPYFNLEFSKVILPWNPFALSIHHSLKEDWCSSAHSLGTTCLPAQVPQALGLGSLPLQFHLLLRLVSGFCSSHSSVLEFPLTCQGVPACVPLHELFPP